ncbi:MAG: thiamine pyrophosphate-dependent enzyme [Lentisphaeria bacterium]|nr:thiamine pyrophosphate-dependent enzyme [Lentisphaeria bacterium]MDY0175921.1 thiamine pyrophosphate-dependent enzyme [Lentisphaeria bacterium]
MSIRLLLGDEALAQAALDAGVSGCYAYPGTPSTEIMEYFQSSPEAARRNVQRSWSSNEKVAMEEALGMSYAGKRSLVCMKHVGLNVAADAFVNSAITGSHGGLLVAVADDPSMHSSQNEQDSRFYAQFAMLPCLEPSSQQEAYDMVSYAFELSESQRVPVLFRLTTRLSHSRANVRLSREKSPERELSEPEDARRFILLPGIARQNYARLCDQQADFAAASASSPFNRYIDADDKRYGIICCGLAYNYVQEAFAEQCPYPLLKVCQYPLPQAELQKLFKECEQIMVVEEGMPFIEQQLRGPLANPRIKGRLSGDLPRVGELNPRLLSQAFKLPLAQIAPESELLRQRPPRLCDGCPHTNTYEALNEARQQFPQAKVFGDIGCYTLGALPPHKAIASCLDMGASISMAKGAADAGLQQAIAVIGDSTFTHSGMTGLLDAVWQDSPITVIIVDNDTTGMTGGQDSMGSGGRLDDICKGIGVNPEQLKVIVPLPKNHRENVQTITEALAHQGLSVIIARRECVQTLRKKVKRA